MQTVSRKTSTTITSGKCDLASAGSMGVMYKLGGGMNEMDLLDFDAMRMGLREPVKLLLSEFFPLTGGTLKFVRELFH